MAVNFDAALRNEQPESEPMALRLSDARILEIAMGHFKPGHTVAAEKNFLACVHDIFAQAAPQPSASPVLTNAEVIRQAKAAGFGFDEDDIPFYGSIDNYRRLLAASPAAPQPSVKTLALLHDLYGVHLLSGDLDFDFDGWFAIEDMHRVRALLADHSRDVTKLAAEQPSDDERDAFNHWYAQQTPKSVTDDLNEADAWIVWQARALLAAEQPSKEVLTRVEQLRKALFESRDAMRVMANWVKKSDPAGYSWAVRMVDRANATLGGEEQPSADKHDSTAAARDVLAERGRQVEAEGWTPEHDDKHGNGEMALAAGCYAANAGGAAWADEVPSFFPWTQAWWKPTTPRRDLVKAGALILAEIERIDRAEMAEQPTMMHTTPPCACVAYSLNKKDRA